MVPAGLEGIGDGSDRRFWKIPECFYTYSALPAKSEEKQIKAKELLAAKSESSARH